MKIVRRRPAARPTSTEASQEKRPVLLAPLGALFVGGVMAFGREANADGPIFPGPVGKSAATAPLDVETRSTIFATARESKPSLNAEIDRLANNGRFEQLPITTQAAALDAHGAADRQTRSFLRGLVTSQTFAEIDGALRGELIDVVTSASTRVRGSYRALISSADYQASATDERIVALEGLVERASLVERLESAAKSKGASFRTSMERLLGAEAFTMQPRSVQAAVVEQLIATNDANAQWVVGLGASDTYRHVAPDSRVALVEAVGADAALFRQMYRTTIASRTYQTAASAQRADQLEAALAAHVDAETGDRTTYDTAALLCADSTVLASMPGATPALRATALIQLIERTTGPANVRAAKIRRLPSLVPGGTNAERRQSMQRLWTSLEGSNLQEKLDHLLALVPLLATDDNDVATLRRIQTGYPEVWRLAGGTREPLVKEMNLIVDHAPDSVTAGEALMGRAIANPASRLIGPAPVKMERIDDHTIDTADGPLPARVYRPIGPAGPRPVIQFNHGGAFLLGDIEGYDAVCRRLAALTGCTVVTPEYRLAPEHPFPAALDDAMACYGWIVDNAETLGVDASKIAVAGDSAGGNLAAAMTHRLAGGDLAEPKFQALVYPWTDLAEDMPSRATLGERNLIRTGAMQDAARLYARRSSTRRSPDVSPLRAESFVGRPNALVMVGGHDPLRDEGIAYADALAIDGVTADVANYPAQTHGFLNMADLLDMDTDPIDRMARAIREGLGMTDRRPAPQIDHARAEAVDRELFDALVELATEGWAPHERRALDNILSLVNELAGADQVINYGDREPIIRAILSDTSGLIGGAHEGINMMVQRPLVNRIAHNAVDRAFQHTRRPFAQRRRAKIRGRVYGEARAMASRMLDDALSKLKIDPSTAGRPDPDQHRCLSIARLRNVESDIAVLRGKVQGMSGGEVPAELQDVQAILQHLLNGTGVFDRPVFADGVPVPHRLSLYVRALDRSLGGR